jgi:hypothetical protein
VEYDLTGDWAGSLGGKWRSSDGKVGEWYVISRHLQGCSPRLCLLSTNGLAPREQVLNVPIAYWYMGLVSLIACYRQKLSLSLLIHWLAWEINWIQTHVSVSWCDVDCVGSPFSQEQWDPSKSISGSWNIAIRVPREICMVDGHTRTECRKCVTCWSGFSLQDVHWFESPWFSDKSNRLSRDSLHITN